MSESEIYIAILLGLVICLLNWRAGFCLCLVAGFFQDPIRKVIPEQPVYFTALVVAFVAMTLVGAYLHGIQISFRPIHAWNGILRTPLNLFIILVLIQGSVAFIKTGNLVIAGIGLIAYLSPLPAVLLGYHFGRSEQAIASFIKVYLVICLAMLSGIYLSYVGYDWKLLESVGEGLTAFSPSGDKLELLPGFLRSPEIAAWHAATSICMIILLSSLRRQGSSMWVAGVMVLFLGGALLLTGRRKFLAEIVLFACAYCLLLIWFRKGVTQYVVLLVGGMFVACLAYAYLPSGEFKSEMSSYSERGASVQGDAMDRATLMTVDSFQWVVAQNGILGAGAGTGSQGAQHFGGGSELVGGAAEGGLAKVLAELGVPGLLLLCWLVISLVRYIFSVLVYIGNGDPSLTKLTIGITAFLAANAPVYAIAHQVFGDPFVLTILGMLLGFIMAMPRVQKASFLNQQSGAQYLDDHQMDDRRVRGNIIATSGR